MSNGLRKIRRSGLASRERLILHHHGTDTGRVHYEKDSQPVSPCSGLAWCPTCQVAVLLGPEYARPWPCPRCREMLDDVWAEATSVWMLSDSRVWETPIEQLVLARRRDEKRLARPRRATKR